MNDAKHIAFDSFDARSCCFGLCLGLEGQVARLASSFTLIVWQRSKSFQILILVLLTTTIKVGFTGVVGLLCLAADASTKYILYALSLSILKYWFCYTGLILTSNMPNVQIQFFMSEINRSCLCIHIWSFHEIEVFF